MSVSIIHGIIDNDHKGESGKGTIFYVDTTIDGKYERKIYSLLELLDGTFDIDVYLHSALERIKFQKKEKVEQDKRNKQQKLEEQISSVGISQAVDAIITSVLAANSKAVGQFKSGKEKALNALVGQVIGKAKTANEEVDPFSITETMKRKILCI